MKKTKILTGLFTIPALAGIVSSAALISGCSCSSDSDDGLRAIPKDYLNISGGALYGFKDNVDYEQYEILEIPEGVKTIASGAFKNKLTTGCNVTTVKFNSDILKVEPKAFENCTGIIHFDVSKIDERNVSVIDWSESMFGANKPNYVYVKVNDSFTENEKVHIYTDLIKAGIPESCLTKQTTGHIEMTSGTKSLETDKRANTQLKLKISSEERYNLEFSVAADRTGGTHGVGVRLNKLRVEDSPINGNQRLYEAHFESEIVGAKSNNDYCYYDVIVTARLNGEVVWVQNIKDFSIAYRKQAITLPDINVTALYQNQVDLARTRDSQGNRYVSFKCDDRGSWITDLAIKAGGVDVPADKYTFDDLSQTLTLPKATLDQYKGEIIIIPAIQKVTRNDWLLQLVKFSGTVEDPTSKGFQNTKTRYYTTQVVPRIDGNAAAYTGIEYGTDNDGIRYCDLTSVSCGGTSFGSITFGGGAYSYDAMVISDEPDYVDYKVSPNYVAMWVYTDATKTTLKGKLIINYNGYLQEIFGLLNDGEYHALTLEYTCDPVNPEK